MARAALRLLVGALIATAGCDAVLGIADHGLDPDAAGGGTDTDSGGVATGPDGAMASDAMTGEDVKPDGGQGSPDGTLGDQESGAGSGGSSGGGNSGGSSSGSGASSGGGSGTSTSSGSSSGATGSSSGGSGSSSGATGSSSGGSGSSSGATGSSSSGGSGGGACSCDGMAGCAIWHNVYASFYAYINNPCSPQSLPGCNALAEPSKHTIATQGTGTYDDPSTCSASDAKDLGHSYESAGGVTLMPGTMVYLPEVQQYFVMEDSCLECGDEYACMLSPGDTGDPPPPAGCQPGTQLHIDFWLGPNNAILSGQAATDLQSCGDNLTVGNPYMGVADVIINPPPNLPVNPSPLFTSTASGGTCWNGTTSQLDPVTCPCSAGPNPSYQVSCTSCAVSPSCLLTCASCTKNDQTQNSNPSLQLPCPGTTSVENNDGTLVCN